MQSLTPILSEALFFHVFETRVRRGGGNSDETTPLHCIGVPYEQKFHYRTQAGATHDLSAEVEAAVIRFDNISICGGFPAPPTSARTPRPQDLRVRKNLHMKRTWSSDGKSSTCRSQPIIAGER
jgi:hypothetical protein